MALIGLILPYTSDSQVVLLSDLERLNDVRVHGEVLHREGVLLRADTSVVTLIWLAHGDDLRLALVAEIWITQAILRHYRLTVIALLLVLMESGDRTIVREAATDS